MTVDQIVAEVKRLGLSLVLLTGGEPMLQAEVTLLARRLLAEGNRVSIETSGAHLLAELPAEVVRIVDVKTPSSGEAHRMNWQVLEGLRSCDAVKFVLSDDKTTAGRSTTCFGSTLPSEVKFSSLRSTANSIRRISWPGSFAIDSRCD